MSDEEILEKLREFSRTGAASRQVLSHPQSLISKDEWRKCSFLRLKWG